MRSSHRVALIGLVLVTVLVAVAALAVASSEGVAWRARVVRAKLFGQLPEIPLRDFVRWLAPESPVYLGDLADNPNVVSTITNFLSGKEVVQRGALSYGASCSSCHGEDGRGKSGPDMVAFIGSNTDWTFFAAVKWGRPGTAMSAQPLTDREIWETHAYLKQRLLDTSSTNVTPEIGAKVMVEPASILEPGKRPHEWLTFAGNYAGHRHSPLSSISKQNVRKLRVAWVAQLRSTNEFLEASPIVASNLVFVSESPDGVVALDAATGKKVWEFRRPMPADLPLCCGPVNRGVAILSDSVFLGTLDAQLVAVNASTGRRKWETKVADYRDGYSITGAPLALGDQVLVGVAGGEFGIRGFIAAYASSDGRLLWKFNTVPGPGEAGHETWAGDSWKTGGAPTWTVGAYDADLNLVYWGVGNPAPPFLSRERPGANLFSNSVVAVDARSGELRWHYQFTPGDEHDWDAVQQPVLAEIPWQGQPRAALLWANRNGFFYALDRQTGQFLFARPFAKQTWASGFTPDGRPIVRPEAKPSRKGALVSPPVGGATNWWPPSYDAARRLVYVPTIDAASIYFASEAKVARGRREWLGSTSVFAGNQTALASVRAIEAATGKLRWEAPLERGADITHFVGGVLSTAGGVVFAGYHHEFLAFDSDTGKTLWRIRLGARINAPPVAYAVGRAQFIAVIAGNTLFAFSLPPAD